MKTILLSFFTVLTFTLFGQTPFSLIIDFDYSNNWANVVFEIDTINNNNIWQIGPPQKTLFNYANSFTNVIITDTINTYPVNDTSIFTVSYSADDCSFGSLTISAFSKLVTNLYFKKC